MIITIDGPAASGKSSVAKKLARELNFFYIYSGMLYRAVAYILVHEYAYDTEQLQHPVKDDIAAIVAQLTYVYTHETGVQVLYGGHAMDLAALKHEDIDDAASRIGAYEELRRLLTTLQQAYAVQVSNVIADGRDCGLVVFPHADVKIFLTATLDVRVQRWQHDQVSQGNSVSYEEAHRIVQERDRRDMSRVYYPLRPADDAWCIDTSQLTIEQVVAIIKEKIRHW